MEGRDKTGDNVSLCESLASHGFDANKFNLPLQF